MLIAYNPFNKIIMNFIVNASHIGPEHLNELYYLNEAQSLRNSMLR